MPECPMYTLRALTLTLAAIMSEAKV